jgi:hypothetical protein
MPLVACQSDQLDGRVFLSTIESSDGTAVGIAIDFIPTAGDFDPNRIELAIDVRGDRLIWNAQDFASACIRLPARRLDLLASDGKLDPTSRVTVSAQLIKSGGGTSVSSGGTPAGGAAGANSAGQMSTGGVDSAAGTSSSLVPPIGACTGQILDDAVWPTSGAQVVNLGGSGGGGSPNGGSSGTSGGEAGMRSYGMSGEAGGGAGGTGGGGTGGGAGGTGGGAGGTGGNAGAEAGAGG